MTASHQRPVFRAAMEQSAPRKNALLVSPAILLLMATWTFALYSDSFSSMVNVWIDSRTYTHCFLVIPMAAWLVWQRRVSLASAGFVPSMTGLVALLLSTGFWYLSWLSNVQIGEHFGLVAVFATSSWAVLGNDAARRILYPLLFVFFAVPFGDFLIPTLMSWTANFTVWALNLTGIPVYLEGFYFSLPNGNFEVVEACSGIRFLIVTIVLAIFFANDRYSSVRKKVSFVAIAAASIIVANGLRAYLIVLTAHLTNMKYGAGMEHIYFGWVVFLVVITATFWVGSKYADRFSGSGEELDAIAVVDARTREWSRRKSIWLLVVLAVMAVGPVLAVAEASRQSAASVRPLLPAATSDWRGPSSSRLGFMPAISGASSFESGEYRSRIGSVDLHTIFFADQRRGAELISYDNRIFDTKHWRLASQVSERVLQTPGGNRRLRQALLKGEMRTVVIWYWYDIGGRKTTSEIAAKIIFGVQRLFHRSKGDALVVVATDVDGHDKEALDASTRILTSYMADYSAKIDACIRPTADAILDCDDLDVRQQ